MRRQFIMAHAASHNFFWLETGIEIRFDPHRTTTLQLALPSHVIRRRFEYQMQGSFGGSEETGLRN